MSTSYTVRELAEIVGGEVRGRGDARICGVAEVADSGPDQAAFVSNPKYARDLEASKAGVVLVPNDFDPTPMPAILCDHIDQSVAKLLGAFARPVSRPEPGVHPTAVIHESARIGPDPSIGPHVVIEADASIGASCVIHAGVFIGCGVTIGDDCALWPNVVIRDGCVVGSRVLIHPNAVIGADGLGFYFEEGRHHKVPHIGVVVVEDDVEIGACACIDRAKFGQTVVGAGTKIDNLVQIAHNVQIGEHCILAALSGIAGSVRIGDHCLFGGRVGVIDNLTIGPQSRFTAGSLAIKDVAAGSTVSGYPAQDHRQEWRERVWLRRMPELAEQLKDIIARVERLESSDDHKS